MNINTGSRMWLVFTLILSCLTSCRLRTASEDAQNDELNEVILIAEHFLPAGSVAFQFADVRNFERIRLTSDSLVASRYAIYNPQKPDKFIYKTIYYMLEDSLIIPINSTSTYTFYQCDLPAEYYYEFNLKEYLAGHNKVHCVSMSYVNLSYPDTLAKIYDNDKFGIKYVRYAINNGFFDQFKDSLVFIKANSDLWKCESCISMYNPLLGDIQYLDSVHFIKGNWEDFYRYERKLGLR